MISNRVVLAISCVLLLAGCAVIFCFNNDDYTASVDIESGNVSYTISGMMPCDYSYRVYSDVEVLDRLYLYYDENYTHYYTNEDQHRFFTDIERVLKARDYNNIEYVDANGLKGLIDDPYKAEKSGLLFVSGSIPDTIYDETSMRLTEWTDNGGTLFWSGPEIGSLVSHGDDYEKAEIGRLFKGHINDGEAQDIESISEMGQTTGLSLVNCIPYGLEKDYPGSVCLSTCSKDYSSSSVLKYSNGRIFIFGGQLTNSELADHTALAEIIICGINENTVVKCNESFHKGYGDASGTVDASVSSGDVLLLTIGKPYSSWARSYQIP